MDRKFKKIGIKVLQPSIDYALNIKRNAKMSEKLIELYNFIKEECLKNELEFFKIEDLEKFVKTGSFSVKEPALGIE